MCLANTSAFARHWIRMMHNLLKYSFNIFLLLLLFGFQYANGKEQSTPSTNKKLQFTFYGQGDSVSFWGDKEDTVRHIRNLKDNLNCPRARYGLNGKIEDWRYFLVFDAAEEQLREASLRYEEYPFFRLLIGHDKIPYSFWFMTRASLNHFMERGLPSIAFDPGFRLSLQALFTPKPFTFSFTLFGPDANNTIHNTHLKGHVPLATAERFTYAFMPDDKHIIHLGVAGVYQDTDSLARFRFAAFPEIQSSHNVALVDTRFIPHCKNYLGQELETVFILHSLCISAEYDHTLVNRSVDNTNFSGYFIAADYFLTGEHYIYNRQQGAISKISHIRHDYGAWQIATRYSMLDLTSDGIHGGVEHNTTFSLSWFANEYWRFMLNYIYVDTNPSENGVRRHVNILGIRGQLSLGSAS